MDIGVKKCIYNSFINAVSRGNCIKHFPLVVKMAMKKIGKPLKNRLRLEVLRNAEINRHEV